jgi:hypothetical protein
VIAGGIMNPPADEEEDKTEDVVTVISAVVDPVW